MAKFDFEEEENRYRPKLKENKTRIKRNFKNIDPKDLLGEEWYDEDEYYESFEKFRR